MMLQQGVPPGLLGNSNSGDAAAVAQQAAAAAAARESSGGGGGELLGGGGGGSFSEEERGRMEEGERNNSGGGNRWPRQETLALLKIRSDMDVAFRDSSLKGPLWDEVSRKLAELGYHRSAKKCKEKFENVYKYHKRTKEGRTSKADGKTYRFFDQLEALDTHPPPTPTPIASHHPLSLPAPPPLPQPKLLPVVAPKTTAAAAAMPIVSQVGTVPSVNPMVTVSLSNVNPISMAPAATAQVPAPISQPAMNVNHHQGSTVHFGHQNVSGSILSNSTSSSTSSDEEPPERSRKRKRKWKDFFGRLMKEVIDKQEELQMKFLDTLEKRERERTIREEAWRVQEMAKMNREHDLLVQERSIAAAKDAAVISFLQKITEQQTAQNPNAATPQLPIQIQVQENPQPAPPPAPAPVLQQQPPAVPAAKSQPQPLAAVSLPIPVPAPVPIPVSAPPAAIMSTPPPAAIMSTPPPPIPSMKNMIIVKTDNGGSGDNNMLSPSPSRWPKAEVQALIKLRTTLDMKYQENGPKGPLWEEISSSMRKLGYNRNAKRCKEKWENINKYYKKVKESSKKRPEDSKTCPYFHQLDAIYRDKAKTEGPFNNSAGFAIKPENQMAPIMARPEQQWPLAPLQDQQQQQQRIDHQSAMEVDHESENHDDDDEEDDEEDEDEDEGAGYEIVTNKASSMASIE